jgi:hypothetical protein
MPFDKMRFNKILGIRFLKKELLHMQRRQDVKWEGS